MSTDKPFARIAITLPQADLAAADRLAKQQDRSRSWIVAEAIRCYAAGVEQQAEVRVGLGSFRQAQLRRDLALTPEERVREAEETQRVSERITEARTFGTFDEFLEWQRANGASV